MQTKKITLALVMSMVALVLSVHAQNKKTYDYKTMSKAQLEHRVKNAKIEYKNAKVRTKNAKSSYKSATDAYKIAKKNYQTAQNNEKIKKQALKDAEAAIKYRQKLRKLNK